MEMNENSSVDTRTAGETETKALDTSNSGDQDKQIEEDEELETIETEEETVSTEDQEKIDHEEAQELYEAALEEQVKLEEENRLLQAKLALYFADTDIDLGEEFLHKCQAEQEERYEALLTEITEVEQKIHDLDEQFNREIVELEKEHNEKEENLMELVNAFYSLKRSVARRAIHTATGEHLPIDKVDDYIMREKQADEKLRETRLEYVKEKNALQKEEIRKKELAITGQSIGLHEYKLTIFDTQLQKNFTERRMEELETIQMKCWEVVNIITHLKLKLHYLHKDRDATKDKLRILNEQVNKLTKKMMNMKTKHEATRLKVKDLHKQYDMLQDEVLPEDYARLKEEKNYLTKKLEELIKRYEKIKPVIEVRTSYKK